MINISKLYCGLSSFSDDLRYERKPAGRNIPIAVFNCTAKCNLNCLHCYSNSGPSAADDELSTAQAKSLIADLAEYRCPVILFSGGEPFLRPDLFELLSYAVSLGIRTVISTNGTLIDRATAEELAHLNVGYVGVSLDGPEKFHDHFRASPGAFDAAAAGIENCRAAGIKTGLRFTLTSHNIEFIDNLFEIAGQLAVRRICFYHLIRTGRAQDTDSIYPDISQTRRAVNSIIDKTDHAVADDLVDEVLTVGNHADGPFLLNRMNSENSSMAAAVLNLLMAAGGNRTGLNIACINWDGLVFPDQFFRNYSLGSVAEKSFKDIWDNTEDPVLKILRNKDTCKDPRCAKCKWFDLCKGNYRFIGSDPAVENWKNEPPCYLTDVEIGLFK